MSEVIAVDAAFENKGVMVPVGDYTLEKLSVGDEFKLSPVGQGQPHVVETNTLKTHRALGRFRFIQEKQPLTPPGDSLDESVSRMLAGESVGSELSEAKSDSKGAETAKQRKIRIERMTQLDKSIKILMELGDRDAAHQLRIASDRHLRKW